MQEAGAEAGLNSEPVRFETEERRPPFAFISSVYKDFDEAAGAQAHLGIRRRLHQFGKDEGIPLWVAEYSDERLSDSRLHPLVVVGECVKALYASKLLVCILIQRAGTRIRLPSSTVDITSSVFEAELFHASLARKPALVCVVSGYEPEPELRTLMAILERAFPRSAWIVGSEKEVENEIRRTISALHSGSMPFSTLTPISHVTDALSEVHSFASTEKEAGSTSLSFIGKWPPAEQLEFLAENVRLLLSEKNDNEPFPAVLSRLWFAIRELSKVQPRAIATDKDIKQLWVTVANRWSSAAAWTGLHGPMQLGVLAGLHTHVALSNLPPKDGIALPFGPLASEHYSIGGLSDSWTWRIRRFRLAERLATRHVANHADDPSGALGIRASARLRLVQMGLIGNVFAALDDYQAMHAWRSKHGATPSAVGEAKVEYGFALFFVSMLMPWKRKESLQLIDGGIELLRQDVTIGRIGFLIRGLRKAAQVRRKMGDNSAATALLFEAEALSRQSGTLDQLRQIKPQNSAKKGIFP